MIVRSSKLLAVLTATVLTLASGTIQAYASLCQPADKVVQQACCPAEDQGVQSEDCTMGGCDCTITSKPAQQEDAPAVVPTNAPAWVVPAVSDSEKLPSFDVGPPRSENVVILRDRAPPKGPQSSANGLRAPPSQRA
ncbi:MAG: hypothetical protein IH945_08810 [Armatimonadetes bacterium]|nr:hypothetical protein [Armatimonadota bacterium]